ncbi:uncharacterized protein LOC123205959 [Mangifera indica]|uniref:uncharacterized protein LOC123205959 n=1 Tax=Mangifera indica TaxID=29780 RepID=UPI001CFAE6C8|nr:uncharacterized protein LOC123205959 [Mangifera indica]
MYVTRPLSMYRNFPSALSVEPREGPYSGFLVITDEEAEAEDSFCWGACKFRSVKRLPFPQDKLLTVVHSSDYQEISKTKVLFIPVLDQPLSSNRYYVIRAKGKYKGQACKSSRENDMGICCFNNIINDEKPKPFDHRNIYQQFKIHRYQWHNFFAKSAATDGLPPRFLRKKGWEVRNSRLVRSRLSEALGLDNSLRALLPSFDFSISSKRSNSNVVGTWYCPFIFVREKARLRHQMKRSVFYKMTLEQRWEEIVSCQNNGSNVVNVNTMVKREASSVFGMEALRDNRENHAGFVWFIVYDRNRVKRASVGLSVAIVEKMRWVEEEGGWVGGGREKEVRVQRVEENTSESGWQRFGCYVLVESFALRRMDETLVLRCKFIHTQHIKCKWE